MNLALRERDEEKNENVRCASLRVGRHHRDAVDPAGESLGTRTKNITRFSSPHPKHAIKVGGDDISPAIMQLPRAPRLLFFGRRLLHYYLRTGAAAAPRARPANQHDVRSEDAFFVSHLRLPATTTP